MVLLNTKEFPQCPAGCVIGLIFGGMSNEENRIEEFEFDRVSSIQFMYINTNLGEFRLVYKLFYCVLEILNKWFRNIYILGMGMI